MPKSRKKKIGQAPTARQKQVINYIYWRRAFGYRVTTRLMMTNLGLASYARIHQLLLGCRSKGLVVWQKNKGNTFQLTELGLRYANRTVLVGADALLGLKKLAEQCPK